MRLSLPIQPRIVFLLLLSATLIAAMAFVHPLPQNPAYHHFADHRTILGFPNFWNVISNLPFLLVGVLGLRLMKSRALQGGLSELRPVYWTFFIGISCVAFGSGYYHWSPSNQTLVWDRLPMTIAFMAFFAAIVGERISVDTGRRLLWPLLLIGVGSVVYWYAGEQHGVGDLRLYALVQFLPMLLIPIILVLFPSRLVPNSYVWGVLGSYALSKLAELWDGVIFHKLHVFSGHSIKHLLAAFGTYCFLLALQRRHFVSLNNGGLLISDHS